MYYFTPFPKTKYKLNGKTAELEVTNITRRFALTSFLLSADVIFDEYHVQDGETPDHIAYDYYDDGTLDWLILLTDEIKDPYYEWPRSYDQFNSYLIQKYGSVEYALNVNNIHHYEKIVRQRKEYRTNYETIIVEEKALIVDYATYAAAAATDRRAVTIYDYENELNEQRRQIYLLDLNLLQSIKDQHPTIFNDGEFVR